MGVVKYRGERNEEGSQMCRLRGFWGRGHNIYVLLFTPWSKRVLTMVFCEAEYDGEKPFLKMHFQKTAYYRHICEQ